jgi:membrane protease YdiL (CAAX protease family)
MSDTTIAPSVVVAPRRALFVALVFACVFPTVMALTYFLYLPSRTDQADRLPLLAYYAGKVVQFGFPIVFLWWLEGFPLPSRPHFRGLPLALAFGLLVAAGMFGLYFGVLRGSAVFGETPRLLGEKLRQFHADTPGRYLTFAAGIVLVHSLMEEYYWRWFVFGQMRRLTTFAPAATVSSLAFMAHHVVILWTYFPGYFWTAALPFSLCIAVGGFVWAWLYERNGSVYAPWLSHLCVDAAIFVIGWDLAGLSG